MTDYRWNKGHNHKFWDPDSESVKISENTSDKDMINDPSGYRTQAVLNAMCRVLSELVAIEEVRSKALTELAKEMESKGFER